MVNKIVGEHPSRRKKRLRSAMDGLAKGIAHLERARWLGEHQNNNPHTRPQPSLPYIHMPVVDWDVRPTRVR